MKLQIIPVEELAPPATNPRKHLDPKAEADLASSIKEKGVIVPLLVRPQNSHYEITSGARRFRAAKAVGLKAVPCLVVDDMSDTDSHEVQIVENLQRENIHPLEEAQAFQAYMDSHKVGISQLSERLGKLPSYIAETLNLLKLDKEGRERFTEGILTLEHARLLAKLTNEDQQKALRWLVGTEPPETSRYSQEKQSKRIPVAKDVKLFRSWIDAEINLVLSNAPWDKEDATLVEAAGACTLCPKNSGFNRALFPELQKNDTCTDRTCFRGKLDAYRRRMQKATRKAEKKDFLLLSTTHHLDSEDPLRVDGVKTAGRYKVINEKNICEFARKGQFIDGPTRGKVVLVCNYPKCPKHYGAEMKAYGREPGPVSAKGSAEALEFRRQRNNDQYTQELQAKISSAALLQILAPSRRGANRLILLREAVLYFIGGMEWFDEIDEPLKAAGLDTIKELKKAVGSMKAEALSDVLWILVLIRIEWDEGGMTEKIMKSLKFDTAPIRKAMEKDLHRCEVCRCSEITACRHGDDPCAWRPELVKAGKYICSGCEVPAAAEKAPPTKKSNAAGKGKKR